MDIEQVIREVRIVGSVQGMDAVANAYDKVADAADRTVVVTEKTSKAQASAEAAVEKLRLRYQDGYRQQQQYTDAQAIYARAVDQGRISQSGAAAELANIQSKLGQVTASQKALGVITSDLNNRMQSSAGSFGVAGQAMSALGPYGIAAAAAIGTVIATLYLASNAAHDLADKAKTIREFSEATGLTTTQFQALRSEAGKFGIDSETLSAGLSKFTAGFNELRLGNGALLTDIRKINPALADQMQTTTDAATAFTLFGKAVQQTGDIFQRNALLKAGLGKGSAIFGSFFESAPDVTALTAAFAAAGKGLDENLIKKLAVLSTDIARTKSAADTVFASVFSEKVLSGELAFANALLDMAKTFKLISEFNFPTWLSDAATYAGKLVLALTPLGAIVNGLVLLRGLAAKGAAANDNKPVSMANFQSPANSYSTFQAQGTSGAPAGQKTPEALAADWKNYVAVLGSAATPTEKLNAAIAELYVKARDAGQGADVLARGIAGLKLDDAIARQNAHNSTLGAAASVTDIVAAKTLELAKAQQQGAGLTTAQIDNIKRVTAEQALGTYAINTQIDGEKIRIATLFMGTQAATSYAMSQAIINKAVQDGKPLSDSEIAQIKAKADAYAKLKTQADLYTDTMQLMKDSATDVGKAIFSAFLSGKNVMDAMVQSLDAVAKKLADKSFENILGGIMSADPAQAALGIAQAAGSALISAFTGDQKAKAALQAAQAAWAAMSEQVVNFNLAAKGFNLGPLTNELQSLLASYTTIQAAALKAGNQSGADDATKTFQEGAARVLAEFHDGTAVLTPLQQSMKDLNDEAAGLQATLADLHDGSLVFQVGEDLKNRMAALLKTYQDTLVGSLTARLNTANGNTYLNDATSLLTQHAQDLSDAAALGNSPALLAQISATFQAEAQKIVESAGLTGDAFNGFIQLFPDFAGVVTQSATALAAANDKFAALAKTINDYLNSLQFGSQSILSPQDQLNAAQSSFNAQLALAQGGNADALGSITQYASTLLTQASGFYASSSGYSDIYRAVTAALSNLTGNTSLAQSAGASMTSSGTSVLAGSPVGGVTMPQVSQSAAAPASNDNGQYFATQTQALVQAIGAAATAEIAALQDGIEALKSRLDRIAVATEASKAKPARPATKGFGVAA